jgi:hypothetical protein
MGRMSLGLVPLVNVERVHYPNGQAIAHKASSSSVSPNAPASHGGCGRAVSAHWSLRVAAR